MRTFLVHGSAVAGVGAITRGQRDALRELQDLYMRADPVSTMSEEEEIGRDTSSQYQAQKQYVMHVEPSSSAELSSQARPGNALAGNMGSGHNTDNSGIVGRPAQSHRDTLHGCGRDSAIDVATLGRVSVTVSPKHSNKRRRASHHKRVELTNKRTMPGVKQQVWSWGPESTSLDKATWLPQMMQWNVQDVQDVQDIGTVPNDM
jgi:hypothetical protein